MLHNEVVHRGTSDDDVACTFHVMHVTLNATPFAHNLLALWGISRAVVWMSLVCASVVTLFIAATPPATRVFIAILSISSCLELLA